MSFKELLVSRNLCQFPPAMMERALSLFPALDRCNSSHSLQHQGPICPMVGITWVYPDPEQGAGSFLSHQARAGQASSVPAAAVT